MKKIMKTLLVLVWILVGACIVLPLFPVLEPITAVLAGFRNYLLAIFVLLTLIGIASLVIGKYSKEVNDDEKKLVLKDEKKTLTNKEVEQLFADLQLAEFTLDGEEKPGAKSCETLSKKKMLREALVVTSLSKKEQRKVEKQQQRADQKAARQKAKNNVYLINNIPRNDLVPIRNRKNGWAIWLFLIVFEIMTEIGLYMIMTAGNDAALNITPIKQLIGATLLLLSPVLFVIILIVKLVKRKNVLPAFAMGALFYLLATRFWVYLLNDYNCLDLNNIMGMLTNVYYVLFNVGFVGTVIMLIVLCAHYSKDKYVYLTNEQVKAREDKLNKKDRERVAKFQAQLAAEEAARKAEEDRIAEEKRLAEEEAARIAEEERLAAEQAEAERLAAEEAEEAARKEAELQAEIERLRAEEEAKKAEEERLVEEEAARKEAELRAEVERIVSEEVTKRRLAREEEERLIAEEKAAKERLEAEKAEAAKRAEEEEVRKEAERMARIEVLVAREVARILNEDKLAREEAERKAAEEEAARISEAERKATIERLAREEAERLAAEAEAARVAEQERLAAEQAEAERLAQEEARRIAEIKNIKPIKLKPMPKAKVKLFDGLDANVAGGWGQYITQEQEKDYYKELMTFVKSAYEKNNVYPTKENLFKCFEYTDITNAKVVILGKLPFYRKDQADGLAYSTKAGSAMNQTTKVIVQEAVNDVGIKNSENGSFVNWAKQGVLLLNSIMTAPADKPASHQNCGWMQFTDGIIKSLNDDDRPKVFILWGEHARERVSLITNPKHLVLEAPNPSPLSAANGFYGSKPFSKTNEFLTNNGYEPIDWEL